jgi:hypothetical protein
VDENRPIGSIPGGDGSAQMQKHGIATSYPFRHDARYRRHCG